MRDWFEDLRSLISDPGLRILPRLFSARCVAILGVGALAASVTIPAQQTTALDSGPFAALSWRNIGPHRASRTVAAAGHQAQPLTFYMAQVNGGVWKTTDAGRTWKPIFDEQGTGSIGPIAVAPSDPNVVYVGSGEGLHRPDLSTGDGVYKSTDAGATWTHLGLRIRSRSPTWPSTLAMRRGCSSQRSAPLRTERRARHLPLDR